MAAVRDGDAGWRRPRRHIRGQSSSYGATDDVFGAGFSDGLSFSSNCDEGINELSSRDKLVEDALFGLFRREAVKSLKRKFSTVCKDTLGLDEDKKGNINTSFTRFGLKYFVEVIKKLSPVQRAIIEKFGFGCLLLFDCSYIPSVFSRWVAGCVDPFCSQMIVCQKSFLISKNTFHVVLGLPIGGMPIPSNSHDGTEFILSHFQLSDMPHITFFGNKLCGRDPLSELDVFVCFMTVAFSCFLCPGLVESVNTNHLALLKDPAAVKHFDFSKLVYEYSMSSLGQFSAFGKSRGRRLKAPFCCNYALVVRYLDFLDFGIKNVDQSTPRVHVWRGNMIKVYSDLDCKGFHHYGKKPLKEVLIGSRIQGPIASDIMKRSSSHIRLSPLTSNFKSSAHDQFVYLLQADVIDGIVSITDKFALNQSQDNKPKLDVLVSSVLDFLCKSGFPPKKVDPKQAPGDVKHDMLSEKQPSPNVHFSPTCFVDGTTSGQMAKVEPVEQGTPDCLITGFGKATSGMTAPALNPIRKVKSRRCNFVSEQDEANLLGRKVPPTCQTKVARSFERSKVVIQPMRDLIDLTGAACTNLTDFDSIMPQTSNFKLGRMPQKNSFIEPIKIADTSPSQPMKGKSNEVNLVGSNDFRRRCVQLSKQTDNAYNNLLMSNMHVSNLNQAHQDVPSADVKDGEADLNDKNVVVAPIRRKFRFVNLLVAGFLLLFSSTADFQFPKIKLLIIQPLLS